jgi:hypothetical protein
MQALMQDMVTRAVLDPAAAVAAIPAAPVFRPLAPSARDECLLAKSDAENGVLEAVGVATEAAEAASEEASVEAATAAAHATAPATPAAVAAVAAAVVIAAATGATEILSLAKQQSDADAASNAAPAPVPEGADHEGAEQAAHTSSSPPTPARGASFARGVGPIPLPPLHGADPQRSSAPATPSDSAPVRKDGSCESSPSRPPRPTPGRCPNCGADIGDGALAARRTRRGGSPGGQLGDVGEGFEGMISMEEAQGIQEEVRTPPPPTPCSSLFKMPISAATYSRISVLP